MGWLKRKTDNSNQVPDYSQYGTVEAEQFVRVQVPIDQALVETDIRSEAPAQKVDPEPAPAPVPVSYKKLRQASQVMDVLAPWEVSQPVAQSRPSTPAEEPRQPRFLPDIAPSY